MARKDEILHSFLEHDLLKDKYGLSSAKMPKNIREATNSSEPIVKAIALIVDNLENLTPITDVALRNLITQFLKMMRR